MRYSLFFLITCVLLLYSCAPKEEIRPTETLMRKIKIAEKKVLLPEVKEKTREPSDKVQRILQRPAEPVRIQQEAE